MADFEYDGGSGDLSGGGSTRPFDTEGYAGFDPRQRFDASQRFDESFRAPDHFNPGFDEGGHQKEDEIEDDFKGSNGFSYHQADVPPSFGDGFEDEPPGQATGGGASGFGRSFEPDLHSEFGQSGDYTPAHGANGNGFGADAEDEGLFSSLPPQSSDGPILPPPEEMKEEGAALREWKRENAIRLQEKERKEKERLGQVIEEADEYKQGVHEKRKVAIENGKKENRDREKTFLANHEHFHKNAEKQYWKAVAELIPNELPTVDRKGKKEKKEKKTGIVAIKGPKPGKATDMTRLRQVLVKLKHNPPPHMKYKPPPPPQAEKDKDKDKDKKTDKDGKDKKDVKPTEAPESTASSEPSPASGVAAGTA